MFEKFKAKLAKSRLLEEKLYQEVLRELNENIIRDGLWAKALADSDGSEEKAKSKYIKLRVQSMKDETEIILAAEREELEKQSAEEERQFNEFLNEKEERSRKAVFFLKEKGFKVKIRSGKWDIRDVYGVRTVFSSIDELEKFVDSKKGISDRELAVQRERDFIKEEVAKSKARDERASNNKEDKLKN